MLTFSQSLQISALALSMLLAPAAQAQSRDTGVGAIIAQQGNQALHEIRAEFKQGFKVLKPALPPPRPVEASSPRGGATGLVTAGLAAGVRCAE